MPDWKPLNRRGGRKAYGRIAKPNVVRLFNLKQAPQKSEATTVTCSDTHDHRSRTISSYGNNCGVEGLSKGFKEEFRPRGKTCTGNAVCVKWPGISWRPFERAQSSRIDTKSCLRIGTFGPSSPPHLKKFNLETCHQGNTIDPVTSTQIPDRPAAPSRSSRAERLVRKPGDMNDETLGRITTA